MKHRRQIRSLALVGTLALAACGRAGSPATPGGQAGTGGSDESGGTSGTGGRAAATGGSTGTGGGASGGNAGAGVDAGRPERDAGAGGHGGGHPTDGGRVSDAGRLADAGEDARPDAGAPGCAGLVCEDFESGHVDATKWDLVASGGTVTVQQQRAAHGKYAAQFHATAGPSDDWALLLVKNVPAALKGTATYGRMYVYAAPEMTSSIHIQLSFAGRDGTGTATGPAPFTKLRYQETGLYSGRWQQGFDLLDVSPSVEEVSYSNNHIPTGRWACLEWKFDDQPDAVTVWLDGTQVASFDNTNVGYASPGPIPKSGAPLYMGSSTGLIGGFERFGFGFHDWHPQKVFDLYEDDLVLDSKRVGCLN